MLTVFTDCTERSPTFRLHPLDTVKSLEEKCWLKITTPAEDSESAWQKLLQRKFHGLATSIYQRPFETEVEDAPLRSAALRSLQQAGNEQAHLYDFSYRPPKTELDKGNHGDILWYQLYSFLTYVKSKVVTLNCIFSSAQFFRQSHHLHRDYRIDYGE